MITYFKDTGYLSASVSQITASVQWIMMLLGRLTTAWLSTKVAKEKLLPVMGVGIVVFFVLLIMSRSTVPIMIGIVGFGYSMAGIYPTTVSFSGGIIQKYPMAWSFILTIASFGSIIMPSIIGKIAETAGIAVGMSSVAFVVLVDLVCIILLCTYATKNKKEA
jgi:fucose permease